jgi:hypothetical protein
MPELLDFEGAEIDGARWEIRGRQERGHSPSLALNEQYAIVVVPFVKGDQNG